MATSLASLLLPVLLAGPVDDPIELRYTGNLVTQPRGGDEVAVKRFSLYALVTGTAESRAVFWVVEESGGGGWAWPERFGRATIADGKVDGTLPRLLHTFNETKNPIELALPVFPRPDRIAAGEGWVDGKLSYEVDAAGKLVKVSGRDTQRIDFSTNFGRAGQLWVEEGTLVVRAVRKLFLGQGDQFELSMELKSADPVAVGDLAGLTEIADDLLAMQKTTARDANETKPEIGAKTLETLAAGLEALGGRAKGTAVAGLVTDITKDVAAQRRRTVDAANLAAKFVGEAAPKFELTGVDGKPIVVEQGRPLLLHFWGYRGDALEEPYGQVGYISFLQGKREKLGLQIVGVAVDKGLNDATQTAVVKRSVRKLVEFMRLNYPIALDDGTLLRDFGDPRRIGAALPLWVLIDHEGNVASYHTGYYEADPQKGLVDLDAAVVDAIKKMRGRE